MCHILSGTYALPVASTPSHRLYVPSCAENVYCAIVTLAKMSSEGQEAVLYKHSKVQLRRRGIAEVGLVVAEYSVSCIFFE